MTRYLFTVSVSGYALLARKISVFSPRLYILWRV
jgi:hypothetical protein